MDQKEYSFFPIFREKGVLAWKKKKKKKIQNFQTSTPFAPKIEQKEYSFCSKNWPKGVLLLVKKEYSFSFKNPPEAVLP